MNIFPNKLFWRISVTLLLILAFVGVAYVMITVDTLEDYFLKKHQRLHAPIASAMIEEVHPFEEGSVRKDALHQIMHSMMAVNPAVEVYLLDGEGTILEYVVPKKTIELTAVPLAPVKEFIETSGEKMVLGVDPRNSQERKVFSAAPVYEADKLVGYVYIILASEEFEAIQAYEKADLLLSLGGRNMLVTLLVSFIAGLFLFWYFTRNINHIIQAVNKFRDGKLTARVEAEQAGELKPLALTFNDMADAVVANIQKKETLDKLRRELIANISHDLRTPLSIIHGYAETLWMKGISLAEDERQVYIKHVLDHTYRLENLVKELFELSKLEAQQIQPKPEPFSLSELVQDVVHSYLIIAQEKNIQLHPVFLQDQLVVLGDVALIERVLQNLIDNALKFTDEGGNVWIKMEKQAGQACIRIEDSGVGIPEEDLPYIFDRYRRAEKKAVNRVESTGLGLAIVKKIMELHQADIYVESTLGEGTTFSILLPLYAEIPALVN
ncbi:MAG: HAMP domain-containing sensor histidine kinase [Bacteroidota bacterium]